MAMGTFDELAEHGIDFAALLKRDSEDNDDSDSQMNGQVSRVNGQVNSVNGH